MNVKPFQLNGNELAQMVLSVVDVLTALTVNTNVAKLSHPVLLDRCAVCVPAAVNVKPFQLNGNELAQMALSVVELVG